MAAGGAIVLVLVATPAAMAEETPSFRDCPECPQMVLLPAGRFLMGSERGEWGRDDSEGPLTEVVIAKPFAVSRFEVTFEEWDACVAAGGCNGYRPSDQGLGRGRLPVFNVSWHDAKAYTAWLSQRTGRGYRLLSEAEWEYAARAGTRTPFWWGSSISTAEANYDGSLTYGRQPKSAARGRPLAVDSFRPNPFGLYNLNGNVWEWVEDCWSFTYHGATTDGSARTDSRWCNNRVLRGGSWLNGPWHLRSANRGRDIPAGRSDAVGIRVARD